MLSVNKVTPLWFAPGQTKNVTVTGTGFSHPATVSIRLAGSADPNFTVNSTTVVSANEITANITAGSGAVHGTRDVRVTLVDTSFYQRDGLIAVSQAFTLKGTTGGCGFTSNEITVLNNLKFIVDRIQTAVQDAEVHFAASGTSIAQRQAYTSTLSTVLHKCALVLAFLLHADRSSTVPELNSTGVGAPPGDRAAWVAAAIDEWDELEVALDDYRAAIVACANVTSGTARTQLIRAYDIWVDGAISFYDNTVITGKTYATPYPDDITLGTSTVRVIPQVSAVHGDYRMFMWGTYRALNGYANAIEAINPIIGAGQIFSPSMDTYINRIMSAYTITFWTMLATAHVPSSGPGTDPTGTRPVVAPSFRPGMNPRFNVATEIADRLTNRGPTGNTVFRIHETMATGIGDWSVSGATALAARADMMRTMKQVWLDQDQAAWACIFFNSSLIPSQIAQAGDRQGEVIVVTGRYAFTRMDPPSFRAGTSMTVTIQGERFENGMVPSFDFAVGHTGTMGVTVDSYSVVSPNQIKARISVAASATPGLRDLVLTPPAQVAGATSTRVGAALTVGVEYALKGGFSASEQAAIQHLYDGLLHCSQAGQVATAVLGAAGVSQAQMALIFEHSASIIAAAWRGIALLCNSEIGPNGPAFSVSDGLEDIPANPEPADRTRPGWVQRGKFYIDRIRGTNNSGTAGGVNFLASMSTAITAAIAACTDPTVDALLTTARDTHLAAAITEFGAADMTLSFPTPFPDDDVGVAAPSVVHIVPQSFTTHGGHRSSMFGHARGLNYLMEQSNGGSGGAGYVSLIETGVFSSWDGIKAYMTEIFKQWERHTELFLITVGAYVTDVVPPPGNSFVNMNRRMAGVAQAWDKQTNVADLEDEGFQGGDEALNAMLGRAMVACADMQLQVNFPTQHASVMAMFAKTSDSWRNAENGISGAMRWNGEPSPGAPTTRALTALPSTAPTVDTEDEITIPLGQPMVPLIIHTTGSTGALPTLPLLTVTSGTLPTGLNLTSHGNGVFTLDGTAITGSVTVELTAANGTAPDATHELEITVTGDADIPPTITSVDRVTFEVGVPNSFTVTAQPLDPEPTITMTGTLPPGVTFEADGAEAVISGTVTSAAVPSFAIIITAANGTLPDAVQNFTITVTSEEGVRGGIFPSPPRPRSFASPVRVLTFAPEAEE